MNQIFTIANGWKSPFPSILNRLLGDPGTLSSSLCASSPLLLIAPTIANALPAAAHRLSQWNSSSRKTNMDTQNHGLERVTPLNMAIFGSILVFEGGITYIHIPRKSIFSPNFALAYWYFQESLITLHPKDNFLDLDDWASRL